MEYQKEEWRPVVGYEGLYEVSDMGRVRSLNFNKTKKAIMLKQGLRNHYLRVTLHKKGNQLSESVHRIVAFAFPEICGDYFEGAQVNHKDENKTNNAAWNLEWCTPKYNSNYGTGVERSANAKKKPIIQLSLNNDFIKRWDSAKDAGEYLRINAQHIRRCCHNVRKTAYGFKWQYAVS